MKPKPMNLTAHEVFSTDWTDLEAVKRLADKMGPGNFVIKYPDRDNYNITKKAWTIPGGFQVIYEGRRS